VIGNRWSEQRSDTIFKAKVCLVYSLELWSWFMSYNGYHGALVVGCDSNLFMKYSCILFSRCHDQVD
jgi:hypothetical protein